MKRVIVAMSGGVDSSVAALLLKRQGYEVIGITMSIWPQPEDKENTCCGLSAVNDARRVAFRIGIPHYTMNFEDEFEERVIAYFCHEYLAGRTPNPCIACNREIKFGSLLRKALSLEADYIATGHYARVEQKDDGSFSLKLGADRSKDQTYALYQMDQFQLAHTLFPLGDLHKSEVREIAREAGLVTANRPESQEICFVPEGSYSEFVEDYLAKHGDKMGTITGGHRAATAGTNGKITPCAREAAGGVPGGTAAAGSPRQVTEGRFRLESGEWLGPHRGIYCYTVGQRKGLGLTINHERPLYVTRIDPTTGTVWIGEEKDLYSSTLTASQASYISGKPFTSQRRIQAKIRYNSPRVQAEAVSLPGDRLLVKFAEPQKAITPGQAVVLYDGDEVLGGGTIEADQAKPVGLEEGDQ